MRSFTIIKIISNDKRIKNKKSFGGRFISDNPSSAAKKAGSSICKHYNIKSAIKFKIAIKETTSGSSHKVFMYKFSRTHNPTTVMRSGIPITYEFETKVESVKHNLDGIVLSPSRTKQYGVAGGYSGVGTSGGGPYVGGNSGGGTSGGGPYGGGGPEDILDPSTIYSLLVENDDDDIGEERRILQNELDILRGELTILINLKNAQIARGEDVRRTENQIRNILPRVAGAHIKNELVNNRPFITSFTRLNIRDNPQPITTLDMFELPELDPYDYLRLLVRAVDWARLNDLVVVGTDSHTRVEYRIDYLYRVVSQIVRSVGATDTINAGVYLVLYRRNIAGGETREQFYMRVFGDIINLPGIDKNYEVYFDYLDGRKSRRKRSSKKSVKKSHRRKRSGRKSVKKTKSRRRRSDKKSVKKSNRRRRSRK
jgi:hypothetical protein